MNRDMNKTKDHYFVEFLTSKQAATYLGISTARLFNLVSRGLVPYYKFQRNNRYSIIELKKLIEKEPRGIRDGY